MSEIKHSFVRTNGIKMHVAETGDGFPVVFCPGFPEMWYSWRHQMKAIAEAGFRAIAPDQRGYGETDAPAPIEAYTQRKLVGDIVGMLDALGIGRCVIVGHDWGGMVAWNTALMARDSVERVIGINTPFVPRAPMKPTDAMSAMSAGFDAVIDALGGTRGEVARARFLMLDGSDGPARLTFTSRRWRHRTARIFETTRLRVASAL